MNQEKWITETTEVMLLMKLPLTCKKGHQSLRPVIISEGGRGGKIY